MKKSNRSEFIEKSVEKHGSKFNYDSVVYVNSITKVKLICENGHEFSIRPDMHINRGDGCRICKNNKMNKSNIDFINQMKEKYSDKYDYSLVEYNGVYKDVTIICKEHGQFRKSPNSLLKGYTCPNCVKYNKLNRESFIIKANLVHENKYIYDESFVYKNSRSKVKILCAKHGYFYQLANNHLKGHGCNKCENRSKSEIIIEKYLISKSIVFETEFKFDGLRYKYPLRFDFAIFDDKNKVKYLIEFQGRQHFEFVKKFHENIQNFEVYKIRDEIKAKYCEDNKIKLFTIKYNENIENILEKIISENDK